METEPTVGALRVSFVDMLRDLWQHDDVRCARQVRCDPEGLCVVLRVGEVDVRLTHPHEESPHVVAEFELGPLPQGNGRAALLQLLEMNGELKQCGGIGFGIDADGYSVIYREPIALAGKDAEALLEVLHVRRVWTSAWFEEWYG
jgi:hypothetical protein